MVDAGADDVAGRTENAETCYAAWRATGIGAGQQNPFARIDIDRPATSRPAQKSARLDAAPCLQCQVADIKVDRPSIPEAGGSTGDEARNRSAASWY